MGTKTGKDDALSQGRGKLEKRGESYRSLGELAIWDTICKWRREARPLGCKCSDFPIFLFVTQLKEPSTRLKGRFHRIVLTLLFAKIVSFPL